MPRPMRDSGVAWIGQVPEGWRVKRFKFIATSMRKGCGITKDEVFENGDIPCIRYGEIYSRYANSFDRCYSKTRRECVPEPVYMRKGDIAFACTGEKVDEIGKNVLYLGESPCVAGGDILVASHEQDPSFLNYYLNCYTSQFQKSRGKAKLKVVHVRTSDIGNLLVLLPPLSEQRAIAAYLDVRCGEIDAAVAAARRSIEDYKALKKSLVFEAVTGKRGVGAAEPDRPMRDSGVAWIGPVPEGWRMAKTLYVLEMPITDGPHTTPELYDEGVPFVSAEAVSCGNGSIDFNHIRGFISEEFYQECCLKYVPRRNDIYMIKSGATTGRVSMVDTDRKFTIWSPLAVFRANEKRMIPRFLFYYLQSPCYQKEVELGWSFGTQQNIGMRALEALPVLIPPLEEQRAIAGWLDAKCGAIDALVAEKEALVADLERYRKSLVFECVTGKRGVA